MVGLAGLLSSCGTPPENPKSIYFGRLIAATESAVGDERYRLFDVRFPFLEGNEARLEDDLVLDGFEANQGGWGVDAAGDRRPTPDILSTIICNGYHLTKVGDEGALDQYYLSLGWSRFPEGYYINVYRDQNCNLLGVWGNRHKPVL